MSDLYFKRFSHLVAGENENNDDMVEKYMTSFITVSQWVKTVMIKKLGDFKLNYFPADWYDFGNILTDAQAKTMVWTDTVLTQLKAIPAELQQFSGSAVKNFQGMLSVCDRLIQTPNNSILKNSFCNNADNMCLLINLEVNNVECLVVRINEFSSDIEPIGNDLEKIAKMALNDKNVDSERVSMLNKQVADIKRTIVDQSKTLLILSIGEVVVVGGGIMLTLVGFATGGIGGGIAIGFFVCVGALVLAVPIVLDIIGLVQSLAALNEECKLLKGYEADVMQLQDMADDFNTLSEQAFALTSDLDYISNTWKAIAEDLKEESDKIKEGEEREKDKKIHTADDWRKVKAGLIEMQTWFENFGKKMDSLRLDSIEGAVTQLSIGMTPEEVKEAIEKAQKQELIRYLTA